MQMQQPTRRRVPREQTNSYAEAAIARCSGRPRISSIWGDASRHRRAHPGVTPAKEGHKMTRPGETETGVRENATAADRDELFGARLFISDVDRALAAVRVAFLLTDE